MLRFSGLSISRILLSLSLLAVAGWAALRARRALHKKNRQDDQDLIYSRREPVLGS